MTPPLNRCASYEDFRRIARRKLPRVVFEFVDGGSGAETALDDARAAFARVRFEPRWLVDVSQRDTGVTVLGDRWAMPIALAPAGMAGLVHSDGELGVARAAARAGVPICVSSVSTYSLEEVVAVAGGPVWLQLFPWRNDHDLRRLLDRAQAAGCRAVALTVDSPLGGNRERDVRWAAGLPPKVTPGRVLDAVRKPRWTLGHVRMRARARLTFGTVAEIAGTTDLKAVGSYIGRELLYPGASWERLDFVRRHWKGPVVVKGILSRHDAEEAVARGADGVWVSNHGGRQIDSTLAPLDALPSIVEAVGDRAEVLLDGGVRRGEDAVKAKALGARAVFIGRPWVMALGAFGERGVGRMLELLQADVDRTLGLIGVPRLDDVTRDVLAQRGSPAPNCDR